MDEIDLKLTPSLDVIKVDKNWEHISKDILANLEADAIFLMGSSVDKEVIKYLKIYNPTRFG